MEVTNITSYRNRHKPQAFRVGSEAQARRKSHLATSRPQRDMHKWRKLGFANEVRQYLERTR